MILLIVDETWWNGIKSTLWSCTNVPSIIYINLSAILRDINELDGWETRFVAPWPAPIVHREYMGNFWIPLARSVDRSLRSPLDINHSNIIVLIVSIIYINLYIIIYYLFHQYQSTKSYSKHILSTIYKIYKANDSGNLPTKYGQRYGN